MRVRSSFFVIFGLAVALSGSQQPCCKNKKVGEKSYTLLEEGGSVPDRCPTSCIYAEDNNPDSKFCFAPGSLKSTCLGSSDYEGSLFDPDKCPNYNVRCSIDNSLGDPTTVFTPDKCGTECQKNLAECKAWTMIPQDPTPPNATCYFLTNCPKPEKFSGRISGDKSCPPNATFLDSCPFYDVNCKDDNNVSNLNNLKIVKTPGQCGDLCQKDKDCKFWTMVPDSLPPADCYLLSSCENAIHSNRDISGSYDCPPLR